MVLQIDLFDLIVFRHKFHGLMDFLIQKSFSSAEVESVASSFQTLQAVELNPLLERLLLVVAAMLQVLAANFQPVLGVRL